MRQSSLHPCHLIYLSASVSSSVKWGGLCCPQTFWINESHRVLGTGLVWSHVLQPFSCSTHPTPLAALVPFIFSESGIYTLTVSSSGTEAFILTLPSHIHRTFAPALDFYYASILDHTHYGHIPDVQDSSAGCNLRGKTGKGGWFGEVNQSPEAGDSFLYSLQSWQIQLQIPNSCHRSTF